MQQIRTLHTQRPTIIQDDAKVLLDDIEALKTELYSMNEQNALDLSITLANNSFGKRGNNSAVTKNVIQLETIQEMPSER